jgi:hypothetical protein
MPIKKVLIPFQGYVLAVLILLFFSFTAGAQYEEEPPAEQNHFLPKSEGSEPVLQPRDVPANRVKEMKEDDAFWYADESFSEKKTMIEKKRERKEYTPVSERTWFQTLLWLIIIAVFAGAVIWFLAESNIGVFGRKNKRIIASPGEEEISEDIFAINYQKEIDRAAQQGNYRLAIRLMFLRLLKNMSEKNIINYKQDKTNLDYLLQLQPTNYYNSFFRVTRDYEYTWYGQFEVGEEAYNIIKKDFDQIDRVLYKL